MVSALNYICLRIYALDTKHYMVSAPKLWLLVLVSITASITNNSAQAANTNATTTNATVLGTPAPTAAASSGFCWDCGFDFGVALGALNNRGTGMLLIFGTALICCVAVGGITCIACYCSHKPRQNIMYETRKVSSE